MQAFCLPKYKGISAIRNLVVFFAFMMPLSVRLAAQTLRTMPESNPLRRELVEVYTKDISALLPNVLAAAGVKERDVELVYGTDDALFAIYADGAGSKRIHLNLGGLDPLDHSSAAIALSWGELNDDSNWWFDYLLLLRSFRLKGISIVDVDVEPAVIAGLHPCDVSEGTLLKRADVYQGMLDFVIAHEVGHVVLKHDGRKHNRETDGHYSLRRQKQELAADRFAAKVLTRMHENAFAPAAVMLTYLLISGDPKNVGPGTTYPTEYERVRFIISEFFKHSQGNQALSKFAKGLEDALQHSRSYHALDQAATELDPQSLRKDRTKLSLHPSEECRQFFEKMDWP